MKKESIENNCKNCKYSAKEYLLIGGDFFLTKCLFCMNLYMDKRDKNKRIKNKVKCDYFKAEHIKKSVVRGKIEDTLISMSEQLEFISQVLKEMDTSE